MLCCWYCPWEDHPHPSDATLLWNKMIFLWLYPNDSINIIQVWFIMAPFQQQCEKYWHNQHGKYGDIHVWLETSDIFADFNIRTFRVQKVSTSSHTPGVIWPDLFTEVLLAHSHARARAHIHTELMAWATGISSDSLQHLDQYLA